MKLVTLSVTLVASVVGARSCDSSGSSSSPLSPTQLERNGLAGACADAEAAGAPTSFDLPAIGGVQGGTYQCPTTTLPGGG